MKKLFLLLLLLPVILTGQNKLNLLPDNMIKYVGVVDREHFESIVGTPTDSNELFTMYDVENTFEDSPTTIYCIYRESDSKLIAVRFSTLTYLSYWINFSNMKGYVEAKNCITKRNYFGSIYQVNLKLGTLGCQIMGIQPTVNGYQSTIIHYHTVITKK